MDKPEKTLLIEMIFTFRRPNRYSEQTGGQKEGGAQGGAGGGGSQAQGVHQGRGGRHHLTRLRPLQEL